MSSYVHNHEMLWPRMNDHTDPVAREQHSINPKIHYTGKKGFFLKNNFVVNLSYLDHLPPPRMKKSWRFTQCYVFFPSYLGEKLEEKILIDNRFFFFKYFIRQTSDKNVCAAFVAPTCKRYSQTYSANLEKKLMQTIGNERKN